MDNTLIYHSSSMFVRLLEGLMNTKVHVEGVENIPVNTTLFVANHFTRSETFIIPNTIFKHTKKIVRSLANHKVFINTFGEYLKKLGTISVRDPNRDTIILSDLISGRYNWLIYPEGHMIKSKKNSKRDNDYFIQTDVSEKKIFTGSAVLALKSELLRNRYKELQKSNNKLQLQKFLETYKGIENNDVFIDLPTAVVPVTLTYVPIRAGKNSIMKMAAQFVKELSPRIQEELEIEGNILLNSEINIHFGKPIFMDQFLKTCYKTQFGIPYGGHLQDNVLINQARFKLTREFMEKIYDNILIHFDHIFATILFHFTSSTITQKHFRFLIYMCIQFLHKTEYRLHENISIERSFLLLLDDENESFEKILHVCRLQGIVIGEGNRVLKINHKALHKHCDYHQVRLINTLLVIKNEVALMQNFVEYVKEICTLDEEIVRKKVFKTLNDAGCSLLKE